MSALTSCHALRAWGSSTAIFIFYLLHINPVNTRAAVALNFPLTCCNMINQPVCVCDWSSSGYMPLTHFVPLFPSLSRTLWKAIWCMQCVKRWRSWRNRSRSCLRGTLSWSGRMPCWNLWPTASSCLSCPPSRPPARVPRLPSNRPHLRFKLKFRYSRTPSSSTTPNPSSSRLSPSSTQANNNNCNPMSPLLEVHLPHATQKEHLLYSLLQLVYVKIKRRKKLCLLSHQLDHKVQCLCVCVCAWGWVSKKVWIWCWNVYASVLWAFPVLMQSSMRDRDGETWTEEVCV